MLGGCRVGLGNPNPTGGTTTISLPPNGVGMGVARGGGHATRWKLVESMRFAPVAPIFLRENY